MNFEPRRKQNMRYYKTLINLMVTAMEHENILTEATKKIKHIN
jgi:hypothetical protein